MGVVIAQEPVGHPVFARELRGLVGEPERLLSPADGASLAGQPRRTGRCRPRRSTLATAMRASRRGFELARAGRERSGLGIRVQRPRPPGRGPLGEVPGRHRADHGRELMAVASRLQAQRAEGHEEEQPERADPPAIAELGRVGRTPPLASPAGPRRAVPTCEILRAAGSPAPSRRARSWRRAHRLPGARCRPTEADPGEPEDGHRKLSAPRTIVTR